MVTVDLWFSRSRPLSEGRLSQGIDFISYRLVSPFFGIYGITEEGGFLMSEEHDKNLQQNSTIKEKVIYNDELFEIIEKENGEASGGLQRYTRYAPTQGQFVLVLPFKHKKNRYSYLMRRSWIAGWDNHPDLCAIDCPFEGDPAIGAQRLLKEVLGIEFDSEAFVPLGATAASRWSGDIYYLFGIDLTGAAELTLAESEVWVEEESLVQGLDAQAVAAYARLKLVP